MRKLRRAVNGDKEIQLALGRSDLGQIDVKIPDGIPFEALLGRLVAANFGQARDAVALQATMQGRAALMREARLKRVRAIVQRQQRAAAKRGRPPPRLRRRAPSSAGCADPWAGRRAPVRFFHFATVFGLIP
jgi:hypothetical protein